MNRFDQTWHWLLWWTNGRAQSERMAGQIIADAGYENVTLTHPLGGPDHGADATCTRSGDPCVMAAYFPLGPKRFATVIGKLKADLKAAEDGKQEFKLLAFVTNQKLTDGQRKKLKALGGDAVEIDLFDLEICTHTLDLPHMADTKERYLNIPAGKPPLLVAVDVIGAARYVEDGDELLDLLVEFKRKKLQHEAQEQRDNPIDPDHYKIVLAPMMRTLGYGNPPENPPKPLTEDEIVERVGQFRSDLESHWQQSLDYLAAVSWPAVHFRIANGARSFLNNVQVIVTFEDVEGVENDYLEMFRFEKLEDLEWREPDPDGIMAATQISPAAFEPRDYRIKWRNIEGNLRVTITLPELRPTPPWESEEEGYEDIVLVLREADAERVTVAYTVTADTYGEAFEDTFTIPVEHASALDLMQVAWASQHQQQ